MAPLRAVLLDFGHTIVDFRRTEEALRAAYEQIRARIEAVAYMEVPELLDLIDRLAGGVDRLVEASYLERRMEELDIVELFGSALAEVGFELPADAVNHIVALDHSAYSNSIVIEPEVTEALVSLRDAGYRLGLVSNVTLRADLMRDDLDRLGLTALLDASVFSSEVGFRKPDPRIFLEALARVSATPEETAFVGDRLIDDVEGARSVGMRTAQTVQFRREQDASISADAVVEHLSQLPELLAHWQG